MRKAFGGRKKRATGAGCLAPCPPLSTPLDWTGPQETLTPHADPVADLLCTLFREAAGKNAEGLRLTLDRSGECIRLHWQGPGDWEPLPSLPGHVWSAMVLLLPRVAMIESCEGILCDPASHDRWRFRFSRPEDQIRFEKVAEPSV